MNKKKHDGELCRSVILKRCMFHLIAYTLNCKDSFCVNFALLAVHFFHFHLLTWIFRIENFKYVLLKVVTT